MSTLAKFDPSPFADAGASRSMWLQAALGREDGAAVESLRGPTRADICIVGGGLTGLWTALALVEREPTMDVVVLEADICGGGASGRSGGFVMTWWSKFSTLSRLCGREDALRVAERVDEGVGEIERFCATHEIDAGFHRGGWVWAATNPAQVDAWSHTVAEIAAAGAEPYELLDRAEVARLTGSDVHLAGIYEAGAGIVQPAALTRGLAAVARRKGVRIYERTPVTEVRGDSRPSLLSTAGEVSAGTVVLAMNAWAGAIDQLRRSLVVVASDIVITEPIPERLAQIGWRADLSISDSRRLVNYYRPSDDGRVVFGKGGGTLALANRVGRSFRHSSSRAASEQFRRIYPMLADTRIEASWRGPIDYSITGLPFLCRLQGRADVLVAAGFSGNGIGPSHLAGQALANIAIDGRDEQLPVPLTHPPTSTLPPEPVRYLGGRVVRAAIARKERAEDQGREPGTVDRLLAGLDPTSFVDHGDANERQSRAHAAVAPVAAEKTTDGG